MVEGKRFFHEQKMIKMSQIARKTSNNFIWDVIRFHFSRSRYVIDMQFWPVIDINKVRWLAKLLMSHLFDWYFTNWSVNYLYCGLFNELVGEFFWNLPCTQPLLIKIHKYISKILMIVVKIWSVNCTLDMWIINL